MSIRLKLLAGFALLAAAVLGLTLASVRWAVEDLARDDIEGDLGRTVKQLQAEIDARARAFENAVTATLRDTLFVEALGSANDLDAELGLAADDGTDTGLKYAHDLIHSADLTLLKSNDVLALVNASGKLIYSKHAPSAFGADLRALPVVRETLATGRSEALWSVKAAGAHPVALLPTELKDDLLLVFGRRVERGGGALLVGFRVRDSLCGALERIVRGRVALIAPDGTVASTAAEAGRLGQLAPGARAQQLLLEGRPHLAQAASIAGTTGSRIGVAVLMRDLDGEIAPLLWRFQRSLAVIAALVLVLAVLAAAWSSGRLSRPLVRLADAARQVRLGDLSIQLPEEGTDEVGRLSSAFNETILGLKQRDQIKGLFKRYLSPQVVEELIRHPEKASPGGERRVLTVLFSDLVGFTTLAERLTPEDLVALLNEYLEDATRAVASHGATVDKFIGDAVMCFWNAPLPQEHHAASACLAALELSAVVDRLSPRFEARSGGRLDCRIGINTGPCIVGNIGSKEAQDYTVVGDTVNLASRLEGAARVYGVRTLVAAETIEAAGAAIVARELDLLKVKGRAEPVRVFTLLGSAGTPITDDGARFAEGLVLYRARRFREALEAFAASPSDPPSRVFAERCRRYLEQPPADDWNGVHVLDAK